MSSNHLIKQLNKLEQTQEEIYEFESNLGGYEIEHPDPAFIYCVINIVETSHQTIYLYAEDEEQNQYNLQYTFDEFKELIK